jgi:hypothetical protein
VCPTCMCEISFDHRCDPNDIAIAKHADSVRDTLYTTPLLDTITSAHAFERTAQALRNPHPSAWDPASFSMLGGRTIRKTTPHRMRANPTIQTAMSEIAVSIAALSHQKVLTNHTIHPTQMNFTTLSDG